MRLWRWLHRLTCPQLPLKMRRPNSGSFAKITTSESQRSPNWKSRDLSDRRERRESGSGDLTTCERLVVDLARDLGITGAEAAERLRHALDGPVEPVKKSGSHPGDMVI